MILFSGWIYTAGWPRWRRALLFCVPATLLYLFHLLAFTSYCLAVAGYEIAIASRTGFQPWRSVLADVTAAALQAAPAAALLPLFNMTPATGPVATVYDAATKATAVASPVLFFATPADRVAGGVALLLLILGLLTNRLRMAPVIWGPFFAVLAVAAVMPSVLHGVFGMDFRLPLMLALLLIGGVGVTERMGPLAGSIALGCILTVTAVRSAGIASNLGRLDRQIGEVRQVLATMPRGMRLLVAQSPIAPRDVPMRRATLHMDLLAVVDRDAFVPTLFTSFMTVRPTAAMVTSNSGGGAPLSLSDLQAGFGRKDDPAAPLADPLGGRVYWMGWENKFDYLLYEHFGQRSKGLPANVRLVATSSIADLYRIQGAPKR